jgi:integrase
MPAPNKDGTPAQAANRQRLSHFSVKNLKPQDRPYTVWDTVQRGLAVSVQPSGHASWKAIYSFHGRPRWLHLADVTAIGLADARQLAYDAMHQVAQGKDPVAERKAHRHAGTFEELAEQYAGYAKKKNKSWQSTDKLIRRYVLPKWSKLLAAEIVRADVKALRASISAPITANQVIANTSAIFAWAIREEISGITINPCIGVERNPTHERERVLSASEVPLFWKAFDDAGLVRSMALKCILLTGQRPGEVSHMRTEHIKDGWWTLPGKPVPALDWPGTKNGQSHRVWLPAPVLDIIAELKPDGAVFANGAGNGIDKLDGAMRDICKALKVEKLTPHDLRRSHGSTITGLGFGRDAMNRIQNHQEGGIADVYDRHQYSKENQKIMEAVADRIMTLIDGNPPNILTFKQKKIS